MIRINLLPEEYRKKNRTPLKMMLAVATGVTVNSILLAWYAWLAFGVSAEIESERTVLQTELDGLTPQVDYHKSLDGEQLRYAAREKTLAGITASRIYWTRKVDELITVINAGGEGERHFVWLDDLTVQQTANERAKTPAASRPRDTRAPTTSPRSPTSSRTWRTPRSSSTSCPRHRPRAPRRWSTTS